MNGGRGPTPLNCDPKCTEPFTLATVTAPFFLFFRGNTQDYSIPPRSLSPSPAARYAGHPRLYRRIVLAFGGGTTDHAATRRRRPAAFLSSFPLRVPRLSRSPVVPARHSSAASVSPPQFARFTFPASRELPGHAYRGLIGGDFLRIYRRTGLEPAGSRRRHLRTVSLSYDRRTRGILYFEEETTTDPSTSAIKGNRHASTPYAARAFHRI